MDLHAKVARIEHSFSHHNRCHLPPLVVLETRLTPEARSHRHIPTARNCLQERVARWVIVFAGNRGVVELVDQRPCGCVWVRIANSLSLHILGSNYGDLSKSKAIVVRQIAKWVKGERHL